MDEKGNAKNPGAVSHSGEKSNIKCSKTAAAVVELQNSLLRARVVYCSATLVSEPKNLGFMSRLGLWGPGTEHPTGFTQFLGGIKQLGTGAMELVRHSTQVLLSIILCFEYWHSHFHCSFPKHAMHLKSIGAICARTLSYDDCKFPLVENDSDDKARKVYNSSAELWGGLFVKLG